MGACFELLIVNRQYSSCDLYKNVFSILGQIDFDEEAMLLPSFLFSKDEVQYIPSNQSVERLVSNGNITEFSGKVVERKNPILTHKVGIFQYVEKTMFHTEPWIDTTRLPELDSAPLNRFSEVFCQSIINELLIIHKTNPIEFYAMGPEMLIEYSTNVEQVIKKSHNVFSYGVRNGSALEIHLLRTPGVDIIER